MCPVGKQWVVMQVKQTKRDSDSASIVHKKESLHLQIINMD